MKRRALAYALATLLFAGPALAGTAKTYQVTGPVVDVSADTITVKKGNDNWEIARGDDKTDLKPGDKVTIEYTMTAKKVEVKAASSSSSKKKAK